MNFERTIRNLAPLAMLAALIACDRPETPEPAPPSDGGQTSIIREGFEDPQEAAARLAPLEARISFAQSSEELSEAAVADLETILNSPQVEAGGMIVLRAHSDAGGEGDNNMEMSEARGNLVRDWLVERGIPEERIEVIVFGEQNPIQPNANPDGTPNEQGRAANRRVDVTVALPEEGMRPTIAEQIGVPVEEQLEAEDDAAN